MADSPGPERDDAPYAPPLTLTPALLNQVAAIAEALGRWSAREERTPSPRLRRENRIHMIQASLAIEQNSLSLEQVTALFDGKRVMGPARDIQEVCNAITAYEALPRWSPSNGQHLLASCVVHVELEFIHPFADGNGRLGRLWQTLTLTRWNPLLGWLPIEEVIRARQQGYYESLGQADQRGELEPFVSYLLAAIADALEDALRPPATSPAGSEISSETGSEMPSPRELEVLELLSGQPKLSAREMGEKLGISQRAVEKHLAALQRQGRLRRLGSPRSGSWQVLNPSPGA
ncbi:MAG: Fic family protein [Cyanobium sp. CZS 25K]|nr:Fic family protein [Cyanobium sp. CZS25K]